ncbi:MAG: hypothetical protein ACE5L6_01010 [Candidatus Bathyarchaeia archaeon]
MRYIYTRAANENMDMWDVSPSLVQDIVAKETRRRRGREYIVGRVVTGRLITVRFVVLSETETLIINIHVTTSKRAIRQYRAEGE